MGSDQPSRSYYSILGVDRDSSITQIRSAYRKLAMQWHPDRWMRTPSLLSEAKRRFQQIQEAYSVLSDPRKRTIYDTGLYDPDEEEDQKKSYSMEELQRMFLEMAQGFGTQFFCGPSILEDSGRSKRARWGDNPTVQMDYHIHVSGL
ncbi:hypothetical protein HHK36_006810 [Tetracentron sinense]|uniref:J domain-containing protein n=1 Tax=Tetracentron sinense TaxID=13715 RepID=A0A834ZHU6_TETSI|nr:hypothetical protein HHK36_006810 [Tetracentron sinense]